jgi:hypothetical protein
MPATQEAEISRIVVKSQPQASNSGDPILKKKTHHKKGLGGMAPVVECLPSKSEVLSSNPNATKEDSVCSQVFLAGGFPSGVTFRNQPLKK